MNQDQDQDRDCPTCIHHVADWRMCSREDQEKADGWRRVFGRGRGRRDPGGKEGQSAPLPPLGTSGKRSCGTPTCDIVKK